MINTPVLELAGSQLGVLSRAQLRSLGWSRSTVSRARASGALIDMASDVYRLASAPDTFDARCWAATLFADGTGFISATSAARINGLRKMPTERIHFTVPDTFRRSPPDWLDIRFSSWYDDADRIEHTPGLWIATPERMLFGLAARFNQYRFDRAADDAWHLGLIEPTSVANYLDAHRCRGKNGVHRLETWLERALSQRAASQSYLERDLIDALVRVGLPEPERQYPVRVSSGEVVHLDAAWPDLRLAVEPGSAWFHLIGNGVRRDYERDLACAEQGWSIIRLDEAMLASPDAAARRVATSYREHERRRGAGSGHPPVGSLPGASR